jgi:hypothetical protein
VIHDAIIENTLSIQEVSEDRMKHSRSMSAKTSARPVSFAAGDGVGKSLMSQISAFGFGAYSGASVSSALSGNPRLNTCATCNRIIEPGRIYRD